MRRLVFLSVFLLLAGVGFFWLTGLEDMAGNFKASSVLLSGRKHKPGTLLSEREAPKPSLNPLLLGGVNDPLRLISQRYQSLVAEVLPSIVMIQAYPDQSGKDPDPNRVLLDKFAAYGIEPGFTGGGFFIDENGGILTSFQTLIGSNTWIVETADGGIYPAELEGVDASTDIALIRIPCKQTRPVRWAYDSTLNFGQPVFPVGMDLREGPRVLGALVGTGLQTEPGAQGCFYGEYYFLDRNRADVEPGWPVLSLESGVVGMVAETDHLGGFYSTKCAVLPAEILRPVSEQLKRNPILRRAYLGVTGQELTPLLASALGIKAGQGVLVAGVLPDSPAQQAGIQAGDLITRFGDNPVSSHLELRRLASHMAIGARVPVEVMRKSAQIKLSAVLVEHPGSLNNLVEEWINNYHQSTQKVESGSLLKALTVMEIPKASADNPQQGRLIITAVDSSRFLPSSPINPGEFILEINGEAVPSRKAYDDLTSRTETAPTLILRLASGDQARYVALMRRK
ncbi:MAG: PDZ domain-containing protein [Methylacidiphilales bacterium]|nr:PDZ domain-containing protein [Candidatus Methylacidiphilales bacterium]